MCLIGNAIANSATVLEGDFSIRGGVKFGMTSEEVKSIDVEDYYDSEMEMAKSKKYKYVTGFGGLDIIAGFPVDGPDLSERNTLFFKVFLIKTIYQESKQCPQSCINCCYPIASIH